MELLCLELVLPLVGEAGATPLTLLLRRDNMLGDVVVIVGPLTPRILHSKAVSGTGLSRRFEFAREEFAGSTR